jgi:hypothetical protein
MWWSTSGFEVGIVWWLVDGRELWVCYTCSFLSVDVVAAFLACGDSGEELDGAFKKIILLFVHTFKDVIVCFRRKSERIVRKLVKYVAQKMRLRNFPRTPF